MLLDQHFIPSKYSDSLSVQIKDHVRDKDMCMDHIDALIVLVLFAKAIMCTLHTSKEIERGVLLNTFNYIDPGSRLRICSQLIRNTRVLALG